MYDVKYYSVYDIVADDFGHLFSAKNDNSAYRAFELGFKEKPDLNPDDYRLYHICDVVNELKNVECKSNIYPVSGIVKE